VGYKNNSIQDKLSGCSSVKHGLEQLSAMVYH